MGGISIILTVSFFDGVYQYSSGGFLYCLSAARVGFGRWSQKVIEG